MITEEKVKEIADLAHLRLTEDEIKLFATQLARVIEHFDQLSNFKTDGIEPLVTPTDIGYREREDELQVFANSVEKVLANAPEKKNSLFKVPPVV